MTNEESTGVTFTDLTYPKPDFKVIGVLRHQQHRNCAKYTAQSAYFMNSETTDKIIVYARNTESG